MRKIIALLLLTTVAACSGGESKDKAEAPAIDAAAPDDAASTAASAIPDYLQGIWAMTATSCAEGSDTRISVTANEIRFYESVATITKVEAGDMDSVVVDADLSAEGESSKVQYTLAPAEAGTKLTVTELGDGGLDNDYVRCEG